MTEASIRTNVYDPGIAWVTLNKPAVHNAFDPEMCKDIVRTINRFGEEDSIRVVILTGEGKSFCSGGDISHMKNSSKFTDDENFSSAYTITSLFNSLYHFPKPTIAAVNGAARGGGVGLIAACDIAIASSSATFKLSEVRIGMVPAMICPYLIATIGVRQTTRYLFSCEEFDPPTAQKIGLIHEVVDPEELVKHANKFAEEICKGAPNALLLTKKLIRDSSSGDDRRFNVELAAQVIARVRGSEEAKEGTDAFLKRRQPKWIETR